MSPDSNYTKIRTLLLWDVEPPCIPYLGVFLTDLTFLEDGNPNFVELSNGAKLINYDKRRRIAHIIKSINNYQHTPYSFNVVPIIKGYLLAGGEYVDENKCYKLSLAIEPKDGSKPKSDSKSWKVKNSTKATINQRSLMNMYNIEERKSKNLSVSPPVEAAPDLKKSVDKEPQQINIDQLVDLLVQGKTSEMELFLSKIDINDDEREVIKKEIMKNYQQRLAQGPRGLLASTFSRSSRDEELDEENQIPFDSFVFHLAQGDTTFMEKYLEEHNFDVYKSEGIRVQSSKLLQESMSVYPISKKS